MKINNCLWFLIGLALIITTSVASAAEVVSSSAADAAATGTHIRTLAASCAACHGPQGNSAGSTPSLAGLDGGYFITQMLAFKNGERTGLVMQRHAKGLNIDEINLLAVYFSQQKRITVTAPTPQDLKANHGK